MSVSTLNKMVRICLCNEAHPRNCINFLVNVLEQRKRTIKNIDSLKFQCPCALGNPL